MMKNVYSIGAYQINQENFKLEVQYNNPKTGVEINYIPQSGINDKTVLQVIGSDKINQNQQAFSNQRIDIDLDKIDLNKAKDGQ